jgi:hypothetical protein
LGSTRLREARFGGRRKVAHFPQAPARTPSRIGAGNGRERALVYDFGADPKRKAQTGALVLGRRRPQVIDIGQRFCKAEAANIVWQVSLVFQGVDGKPYAQLVRADDVSMRKTVAISALEQRIQYLPVS